VAMKQCANVQRHGAAGAVYSLANVANEKRDLYGWHTYGAKGVESISCMAKEMCTPERKY
jgi:hypothetical protein